MYIYIYIYGRREGTKEGKEECAHWRACIHFFFFIRVLPALVWVFIPSPPVGPLDVRCHADYLELAETREASPHMDGT